MLLNRKMKQDKLFEQRLHKTAADNLKANLLSINKFEDQSSNQQELRLKESLLTGINHPRIKQLIMNHKNIYDLLSPSKQSSKQNLKSNVNNLQLIQQRKWLTKKGKKYLIDFDDNQRRQMKGCFNAMDLKRNGSIGIDELEELLISVGLVDSRQDVKELIDSVDEDKSGKIEFSQFLKMILNDEGQNQQIVRFFKYVINVNNSKDNLPMKQKKLSHTYCDSEKSSKNHNLSIVKQNKSGSCCYQDRNKSFQDHDKFHQFQTLGQNSALKIFQKHPHPKNLPFGMIVSHIRRKHMLTALKIGQSTQNLMKKKSSLASSSDQNKSNKYISNTLLRSSQNMKDSRASLSQKKFIYSEEEVAKGQNVMNNLRKMWDRRMLRQIRERRSKKQQSSKVLLHSLTEKGKLSKTAFPNFG